VHAVGAPAAAAAAALKAAAVGSHSASVVASSLGAHSASAVATYSAVGASPLLTAVAVEGVDAAAELLPSAPPAPPSRAAVTRILQIEVERLVATVRQGGKPAHVVQRVKDTAELRKPIITWAVNLWLQRALGTDTPGMWCPTLKRLKLHPWQKVASSSPGFRQSLNVLEDELTQQVKFGLRTAPLKAIKLAYRALIVTCVAVIGRWPGFQWLKSNMKTTWPRAVDALAATIEGNHASLVSRGADSVEAVFLREREIRRNFHRRVRARLSAARSGTLGLCFRARRALTPRMRALPAAVA